MTRHTGSTPTTHGRNASPRQQRLERQEKDTAPTSAPSPASNSGTQWTAEAVWALGVHTDLVTAGALLGIGRTKAHELARRNEFPVPVLRHGRRYIVPVAPIARLLQLIEPGNSGDRADAA